MSRQLEYHELALEELLAASRWYGERSPDHQPEFELRVAQAIECIAEQPNTWPNWKFGYRRFLVKNFPYQVFYMVEEDRIFICAIRHFKQHPTSWLKRMAEEIE